MAKRNFMYVCSDHYGDLLMDFYFHSPHVGALDVFSRQQAYAIFKQPDQFGALIEQLIAIRLRLA